MIYEQTLLSEKILTEMRLFLQHSHSKSDCFCPFNGTLNDSSITIRKTDAGGLCVDARWNRNPTWTKAGRDYTKRFRRSPGYSDQSLMNLSVQVLDFLQETQKHCAITSRLHDRVQNWDRYDLTSLAKKAKDKGLETAYSDMAEKDVEGIFEIIKEMSLQTTE